MKKFFIPLVLLSFSWTVQGAEPGPKRGIGLGVIFGEPTGLTSKFWRDSNTAFALGVAYSFGDYFLGYGDYLVHFPDAFGKSSPFLTELTPYVGGGLLVSLKDDKFGKIPVTLGVRIPLGLEWRPKSVPIGVMLELAPGVSVFPGVGGLLGGGVGIRYYL